jgi:hypothetical protein
MPSLSDKAIGEEGLNDAGDNELELYLSIG